jgi:hypothetical protein
MPPRDQAEADGEIPEGILDDEDDQVEADEREQDDVQDRDEGQGQPDAGEDEEGQGRAQADGRVLARDRPQRETAVVRAQRLAREARAEADNNKRELAELRAEIQRQNQQRAQETPEQESARLALMEPEQRADYRLNKALDNQNRQMSIMQTRMADAADKSTFAALCTTNKFYAKVASRVETKLAEIRRLGQNVDREALAKYVIGEMVLERGPKAASEQRRAGERNVQRQTVRGGAGRGDAPSDRGDDRLVAARRRALEDVTF